MEVYVDDMLVKSKKGVDHGAHLEEAFSIMRKYGMRLNPMKCCFGVEAGKFLGFMVHQCGIDANPEKINALLNMRSPKNVKEVQSLTGRVAALNRFILKSSDKCQPFFQALKGGKYFVWTPECEKSLEELKEYLMTPQTLSKPVHGEELYLYLAISKVALSAALVREEDKVKSPFTM